MYCGAVGCNVFLTKDKANKHMRFGLTEGSLPLQISILAPPSIQNQPSQKGLHGGSGAHAIKITQNTSINYSAVALSRVQHSQCFVARLCLAVFVSGPQWPAMSVRRVTLNGRGSSWLFLSMCSTPRVSWIRAPLTAPLKVPSLLQRNGGSFIVQDHRSQQSYIQILVGRGGRSVVRNRGGGNRCQVHTFYRSLHFIPYQGKSIN